MVDLLFSQCTPASHTNHSLRCLYPDACETAQRTCQYPSDKIKISTWTNLKVRADKVEELIAGHGFKKSGVPKVQNNVSQYSHVLQTETWTLGRIAFPLRIPHRKVKSKRSVWENSASKLYKSGDGRAVLCPRWRVSVEGFCKGKSSLKIAPASKIILIADVSLWVYC